VKKRTLEVSPNGLLLESATAEDDLYDLTGLPSRLSQRLQSGAVVTGALLLLVFGFSGVAFAAEETGKSRLLYSQELLDIGNELRCPTCQGVSILESETPQSVAMRKEIERQVNEGKNKSEILSFFRQRYGDWILRQPDKDSSFGKTVWALPALGLVLGPVWLVYAIRSSRRREDEDRNEMEKELRAHIQSLKQDGGLA
jgi:cytochrome c-type biogenesis protein CcmH/NrfF